mmetsp:Transcript_15811/g.32706  ORF Transcript_15811/g.32706 Transcript_15811/m.32706 type:complete len:243 (+) Transcript_15811:178-906(+)
MIDWQFSLNQCPFIRIIVIIRSPVIASGWLLPLCGWMLTPMRSCLWLIVICLLLLLLRLLMIQFLIVFQKSFILFLGISIFGCHKFGHVFIIVLHTLPILKLSFLVLGWFFGKSHLTLAIGINVFIFKDFNVTATVVIGVFFFLIRIHMESFIFIIVPVIILSTTRLWHFLFGRWRLGHTFGLIGQHEKGKKGGNGVPCTGRHLTLVFLAKGSTPHEHGQSHGHGGPQINPHDPSFHGPGSK